MSTKKDSAGTEAEKWLSKGHAACLSKKIKMESLAVSPSLLTQREISPENRNKNLLIVIALMLPSKQGCLHLLTHKNGKQVPVDGIFCLPFLLYSNRYQHVLLLFLSQDLPALDSQVWLQV
jgi:hypothetical protein